MTPRSNIDRCVEFYNSLPSDLMIVNVSQVEDKDMQKFINENGVEFEEYQTWAIEYDDQLQDELDDMLMLNE